MKPARSYNRRAAVLSYSTWRYMCPAPWSAAQRASAASTSLAAPLPRASGRVAIPNTPAQPVSATARPTAMTPAAVRTEA